MTGSLSMTPDDLKICYLLGKFPALSETFVLQEIEHHVSVGASIRVISISRQHESRDLARLSPEVRSIVKNVFDNRNLAQKAATTLTLVMDLLFRPLWWPVILGPGFGTIRDRLRTAGLAFAFARLGEEFDVIHGHFGSIGLKAVALRKLGLTAAKIVTTLHGRDLSGTLRRHGDSYYRNLFAFGDLFLPISEHWKDKITALGCDPARIAVQHMGINCATITFKERGNRPGEPTHLVSIGRLIEKKGHQFTLQALAALRQRRPDLPFAFDLIGEGPDLQHLKELAAALAIDDAVTFRGGLAHDQTLAMLDRAMIFVLPSVTASDGDMEGIPVALMEAMAMGMPVISTRHSGIPELVEDQVSGFLVNERDLDGLSRAIETILCEPERWNAMGRAGRQRVEREFDHAKLMSELHDHYRRVVASDRRASDPSRFGSARQGFDATMR